MNNSQNPQDPPSPRSQISNDAEKSSLSTWLDLFRKTAIQTVTLASFALGVSALTKGLNLREISTRTYLITFVIIAAGGVIGGLVGLFFVAPRHGRVVNLKNLVKEAYIDAIERSLLNPKLKDDEHEHLTPSQ